MVEEWKAALEPYELKNSLLSEVYMAAAHGAVEVLAEQWKIRNITYANLHRFFSVSTTQTATTASFQSAVGPPQGFADDARKSSRNTGYRACLALRKILRMCASVASTTFGIQRYVRASSVTEGKSQVGTSAADLHDSIEMEGALPLWDMRSGADRVELTEEFSRERVKACRRRRKSIREATESSFRGFITLLWVSAMAVFAAAVFTYGSRANIVDLLTM